MFLFLFHLSILDMYICMLTGSFFYFECRLLRRLAVMNFLRTPSYSIRHAVSKTLVQWFHAETGTFHLSYGEYAVLPLGNETVLWAY